MKLEVDTIKITLTQTDAQKLRDEIVEILNNNPAATQEEVRMNYPKINEIIKLLAANVEAIPF